MEEKINLGIGERVKIISDAWPEVVDQTGEVVERTRKGNFWVKLDRQIRINGIVFAEMVFYPNQLAKIH
jgi:hypothetical protein